MRLFLGKKRVTMDIEKELLSQSCFVPMHQVHFDVIRDFTMSARFNCNIIYHLSRALCNCGLPCAYKLAHITRLMCYIIEAGEEMEAFSHILS